MTSVDRRRFLQLAGASYAGMLGLAAGGYGIGRWLGAGDTSAVPAGHARAFRSRPDLDPPAVTVVRRGDPAPGYLFVAPMGGPGGRGPLILDQSGEPVWFLPTPKGKALMNFAVQEYRGEPVLTWFDGHVGKGYGRGEYVIADTSYRELARVRAGNGYRADLHELQLTPEGTALISAWKAEPADLRPVHGPRDGHAIENVIQEVDVATGKVLFEWRSLDHVEIAETHSTAPSKGKPLDYLHVNSIDLQDDGSLLVSARNTWALYELDRGSGRVLRRLAGKRSDFALGKDVRFAWQHDARRHPDGTISLFDDGAKPPVEKRSRGLVLNVDPHAMTIELAHAYEHPGLLAFAMGSMQPLSGGGAFVGFGTEPYATEFDAAGRLQLDLQLPHGAVSYRAYKRPWTGRPNDTPALAARRGADGTAVAWVSWNGATEVARWRASTGGSPQALRPNTTVDRAGFETKIALAGSPSYVSVAALDRAGRTLGAAGPVRVQV